MLEPLVCVFTPLSSSGNAYIRAAWETLKTQSYKKWLWIVLENHGGELPKDIRQDARVRCFGGDGTLDGIGAIKRRCCELATEAGGEIFLEFDHDDLLHETAVEKAVRALEDADFCFSDTAEFKVLKAVPESLFGPSSPPPPSKKNKKTKKNPALRVIVTPPPEPEIWLPNVYGTEFGWTSYPVTFQGHELLAQPNPPVTPHNLRLIDWAPNHLRAFRKNAYWAAGGHRADLPVADDHALMLSFFLKGLRFRHIPECLYFYRVHEAQTVSQKNALIRELTERLYDENIYALAARFATDNKLRKIDLCGAIDTYADFEPFDKSLGHDLDETWPLEDNSVGVIRAADAIEHLKSPLHLMNEAYRVLAPGGFFLISVPSTDGRGAWQDPTHVSFWNQNSFWYYTKSSHSRYVPDSRARFQATRLYSHYPNDFCREHSIAYVEAHLIALKEGYSPMGRVEI